MPLDSTPTRPPYALGYRRCLPNGHTDWSRYCLKVITTHGTGPDDYRVAHLTFPDKPAAMAHASAVGATFHV